MSAPAWLTGLVDDAAMFPPGNAPVERALAEHRALRSGDAAAIVGRFVVSDLKVPDLIDAIDEQGEESDEEPLEISVVVSGGAGAIGPAVRWASRAPSLRLRGIEVALRDEEDLSHNARRVLTALDDVEEDLSEVAVHVELPRFDGSPTAGWLSALDEVAAADLRTKFRTGGVTSDAFPTCDELLAGIDAALDRELSFKCTAGLHHAVRQADPETGTVHHGFLNVLAATSLLLEGGDALAALEETSAPDLLGRVDPDDLARARRWFTSFGCCAVLEPHDDLIDLGVLER
ncbi:MAG: hypothetical protein ACJ72E_15530 [Marmoricola sp.]